MTSLNHSTSPLHSPHSHFLRPSYTTIPARFSYPPPSAGSYSLRSIPEMSSQIPAHTVPAVTISYAELKDQTADVSEKIELGFGPNGLGILSISDVPGYTLLRQNLLHLAPRLASLPEEVKRELEDPDSRYNIGWSHGKEKLESGKPDMLKGSFYANPILDVPTNELSVVERYPSYCRPNIWPRGALPELELALGKLILDVGLLLAYHCDHYGKNQRFKSTFSYIVHFASTDDGEPMSSWCGWHTDHGSLTGLTCGIFTRDGVEISCPDTAAGLYVKTRSGQIVKVVYGEDEIAYQIGETTEILSRGQLCATPHCVQAPKGEAGYGVERSTFALFMQPDWDEKLIFPETVNIHEFIMPNGSISFGEYTERVLDKYYDLNA
ncbi:hypothetical protein DH2020_010730 [Rehmannia glutinosa]|uniref:Non-haem dioxygenase N-terminal domain-containing protein n=1 Tax=Rehmannia glutinosa TaxID=99300 RepID=A0ABR0XBE8_REHGL